MKIAVISDTHNKHEELHLPGGDILFHCGDFSGRGSIPQITQFNEWLGVQPYTHKVVIAGNHDFLFEKENLLARSLLTNAIYLQDESCELNGLKIYGSPWQPYFFNWAFNLQRGAQLAEKWAKIPQDTDILLTHGPPFGIGDLTSRGENVGCEELLKKVKEIAPRFHFFGHIHEDNGQWQIGKTTFVNASTCDLKYLPRNPFYEFEV